MMFFLKDYLLLTNKLNIITGRTPAESYLVAVSQDGNFVGHCTFWFDKECKVGILEPLGIHPDHRGINLGKCMLQEGMKRLKELGATVLYVLSGKCDVMPYLFYSSVGFRDVGRRYYWEKEL